MMQNSNRFEKHKSKVYLCLFFFFLSVFVAGGYIGYRLMLKDVRRGVERNIVLREVAPLSTKWFDSLEDGTRIVRRADENGFVEPAKLYDDPDFAVVFLGGSTTVCNVVEEHSRFPYLAGKLLGEATGKKINAYNGGKSGNSAIHSVLSLFAKVVPMRPDAVVLMHAINDLNYLMIAGSYWTPHAHRGVIQDEKYNPIKKWLIEKELGHAFQPELRTAWDQYKGKEADPDVKRITESYRRILDLFVFICRQYDITPILMTQASRFTEKPDAAMSAVADYIQQNYRVEYPVFFHAYAAINETTRQLARDRNVLLIDLAAGIDPTPENMYDSVHLTTKGCQQAARIIANDMRPLVR